MIKNIIELDPPSFSFKNLKSYFSPKEILLGVLAALFLSLFIYLDYFGFKDPILVKTVTSISSIIGFLILLSANRRVLFWSGFFIGVLWFYWIGFSFRYYDAASATPFITLLVGFVYGVLFWVIGILKHPLLRAIAILALSYIHPLSFNWFIPELTQIHAIFGIQKYQFALFLAALALLISLPKWYKLLSLFIMIFAVQYPLHKPLPLPKLKIFLADTRVNQEIKWKPEYKQKSIENNIATILEATSEGYDIVVLPESAFALFLNQDLNLMQKLKSLSKDIIIVTGGLYAEGKNAYNSTYYFNNDRIYIANKVVLVPFGEEIPLPKFIAKWINDRFYDGAEDYKTAKKPTNIKLKNYTFRNAICYEATRDELFINHPKYMIAMSNNAWFTPSIEPTLQKLLFEYFSKKYHTVIYHSANMGKCAVIH